jgi:hypothetical protein
VDRNGRQEPRCELLLGGDPVEHVRASVVSTPARIAIDGCRDALGASTEPIHGNRQVVRRRLTAVRSDAHILGCDGFCKILNFVLAEIEHRALRCGSETLIDFHPLADGQPEVDRGQASDHENGGEYGELDSRRSAFVRPEAPPGAEKRYSGPRCHRVHSESLAMRPSPEISRTPAFSHEDLIPEFPENSMVLAMIWVHPSLAALEPVNNRLPVLK